MFLRNSIVGLLTLSLVFASGQRADHRRRLATSFNDASATDPGANGQSLVSTFVLDAALGTSPAQTVSINYFPAGCVGGEVISGLVASAGLTGETDAENTHTTITVTNDVNDIDSAVGIDGSDNLSYCIRASLYNDGHLIDFYELAITFTVTRNGGITTVDSSSVDSVNNLARKPTDFTASAYLCAPTDMTTEIAEPVSKGSSFSICFRSNEFGVTGIADLTALTLSSTVGSTMKLQDFFAAGAPLFSTNTCETAGDGATNGDGVALTTAVQYCYVTINQIPAPFFFDPDTGNELGNIAIGGTATVNLEVRDTDGSRRREKQVRMLLVGNEHPVAAKLADFTAVSSDDITCECGGGFFFLVCWLLRCLLGFF